MSGGTIVDTLNALFGGAVTTLIGATFGRLMWHTAEVRRENRKLVGKELLWELPVVFGMAIVGEGVAAYLGLQDSSVAFAAVVTVAYLGPRAIDMLFSHWYAKKKKPPQSPKS